jgi:uncharacterized membrane-anchored protein YhcB (DUF1043 family)
MLAIVTFLVGLIIGYVFGDFIKAQLKKLFRQND